MYYKVHLLISNPQSLSHESLKMCTNLKLGRKGNTEFKKKQPNHLQTIPSFLLQFESKQPKRED